MTFSSQKGVCGAGAAIDFSSPRLISNVVV